VNELQHIGLTSKTYTAETHSLIIGDTNKIFTRTCTMFDVTYAYVDHRWNVIFG